MSKYTIGSRVAVSSAILLAILLCVMSLSAGCDAEKTSSDSQTQPAEEPVADEAPPQPNYERWVVYINDDDSYIEGAITYSIALNLTATNPTQDPAGTYTGTATAKTDTNGEVGGQQLTASAIANSSTLQFKLNEGYDSADGALAPLTEEGQVYSGTGSIVMAASGSGSIGGASGGFSNTSGQNLQVTTQGSTVTLKVDISGHTYTFEGTIRGE
ncbi:MAG: hypothetical protein CVT60_05160 [Actinobacteria bacterium HGW-Actinobacteria-10]|jgi:ABC-type Na+ efflux pump permease subunit|nr:MAG: hypothetical protein CVT60_05160 [Actinobacteria bacterium HGW-Actinobacteria-10]